MIFLIGHRGVGKSSLIEGWNEACDLDREIGSKAFIEKFFAEQGESAFRKKEREALSSLLSDLVSKQRCNIIVLGAGFELDQFEFPEGSKFIWIQRESDQEGRVFLDRPPLENQMSPLEEFKKRKKHRDLLFEKWSDFKFLMEEGEFNLQHTREALKAILDQELLSPKENYYATLLKEEELDFYRDRVELRNDFFSEEKILEILKSKTIKFPLLSLKERASENFLESLAEFENLKIDLPMENPDFEELVKKIKFDYISCHHKISFAQIQSLFKLTTHVKWAPELDNFKELVELDRQLEQLPGVSFLPRASSADFNFRWYRLLRGHQNQINFFRFGQNSYVDQPSYFELKSFREGSLKNGAVLGGNVKASLSPSFHQEFFRQRWQSNYLRLSLQRGEFLKENLEFLRDKGILFFSVTAPFKKEAEGYFKVSKANTLYGGKRAKNTDILAFSEIQKELKEAKRVLIFGRGDLAQQIYAYLKDTSDSGLSFDLISARDYALSPKALEADLLIWAAGLNVPLLPQFTSLKRIFDLDYKENSPARELALHYSADYISGKGFFMKQALEQQKFWLEEDKS